MPRKMYLVLVTHDVKDFEWSGDLYKSCWTMWGAQRVKDRLNYKGLYAWIEPW